MSPSEESRRLRELEGELQHGFPQVPVDKLRALVENEWMRYLHAPIRDFVPVLVGRAVRGQLRVFAI